MKQFIPLLNFLPAVLVVFYLWKDRNKSKFWWLVAILNLVLLVIIISDRSNCLGLSCLGLVLAPIANLTMYILILKVTLILVSSLKHLFEKKGIKNYSLPGPNWLWVIVIVVLFLFTINVWPIVYAMIRDKEIFRYVLETNFRR